MITLSGFSRQYVAARKVCPEYAANVQRRAAAIERHARETAIDRVLREPVVNKFLCSLDRSPFTIRSYRSDLLSLWNAAADQDLVPYPIARRIHQPAVPSLLIDCYTVDEVRALVAAAKSLAGKYRNGVARRLYWAAAIALAWDAGFRRGDVWLFRRQAVRPDGTLRIVQHKTQQIAAVKLRPSTLEAIDAIGLDMPFRWMLDRGYFGRHFKRLVKAAGVNRGTFKWLRRSSGSYVEAQQPGAGHKHLGHANPGVFTKHYDARLGCANLPQPPEL